MDDEVKLFSSEEVIHIIAGDKSKTITVIVENVKQYYNFAKNQVSKNIQNRML